MFAKIRRAWLYRKGGFIRLSIQRKAGKIKFFCLDKRKREWWQQCKQKGDELFFLIK